MDSVQVGTHIIYLPYCSSCSPKAMEWLGSIPPRTAWTVLFALAIYLRAGISSGPHSGQGKPPMFGDYEAQRHWQEVSNLNSNSP